VKIFTGSSHKKLANDTAALLNRELSPLQIKNFANGELYIRSLVSVRGENTYLIQSFPSGEVNQLLIETFLIVDALRRASAKSVNLVLPIFPYSRQDKKHMGREALSAKLIASLLERAGSDRIITVDLHSGQLQGFFDIPLDHISVGGGLIRFLQNNFDLNSAMLVAPDAGRANLVGEWSKKLQLPMAVVHKRRNPEATNSTKSFDIIGDVDKKLCILVDDIVDTGSTMVGACRLLRERGASELAIIVIHPILSKEAIRAMESLQLSFFISTDTLPVPDMSELNFKLLTVAPLISQAIRAVEENGSITELYD
jgi:ribose-phosphate pyrophosphokinase